MKKLYSFRTTYDEWLKHDRMFYLWSNYLFKLSNQSILNLRRALKQKSMFYNV